MQPELLTTSWPAGRRSVAASPPRLLLRALTGVIAAAVLLPLVYLLLRALGAGVEGLAALANWRTLIVVANSLLLAGLVTVLSAAAALPLAWLTIRTDLPGRRIWAVLTALPLVFPSYVGAYALVAMMGPRGIVQGWLEPLGIERLPSIYGLPGATWALTLFTYPYLLLTLRSGLRHLDPALEEASRSLGCGALETFRRVTLPGLRPSLAAGSLLVALYVLSDFGAVSLLRFNSFTRVIYLQYVSSFNRSSAALLSLVLVVLTLLLLAAIRRFEGRQRLYRAGVGTARAVREVPLGRWRWPALFFCAAVVMAALVLPASVIVTWLIRGLRAGESLLPAWQATLHSLQAAALAAGVAALLALPVAYQVVRYPGRWSTVVHGAAVIGYGLPGIVVALSLVFLGANYAPWLYQTLALLLFAYMVRFLPETAGTVGANLHQISPRLEEAARSLGHGRRRTLWRVTIPLLRPGLWTGAALVFLSTLKELPATLLLGPTGFDTLATQIWAATAEAYFARAAASSLLLLAVSALGIGILLGQEERGAP